MKVAVILSSLLSLSALAGLLVQQGRIAELEAQLEPVDAPASDPAAPAGGERPRATARRAAVADLQLRLARLEAAVATSRTGGPVEPAADGQTGAVAASESDDAAPPDSLARMREELDAVLLRDAFETDAGRRRLQELIRETQSAAWQERREEWRQRESEEVSAELQRLAQVAGLDERQVEEIGGRLETEQRHRYSIWQAMRSGEKTRRAARDEMDALRAQTDDEVRALLSADQYDHFQEMRNELGGGDRRRRR